MLIPVSAILFCVLSSVVILFHTCLIAGLPWGEATMGGRYPGKLPISMRFFSLFSILVIAAFVAIILAASKLWLQRLQSFADQTIWYLVGALAIMTFSNMITPSAIERQLWAPVIGLMLVSGAIVAWLA